jgi:flagellar hook-length control protein FliK
MLPIVAPTDDTAEMLLTVDGQEFSGLAIEEDDTEELVLTDDSTVPIVAFNPAMPLPVVDPKPTVVSGNSLMETIRIGEKADSSLVTPEPIVADEEATGVALIQAMTARPKADPMTMLELPEVAEVGDDMPVVPVVIPDEFAVATALTEAEPAIVPPELTARLAAITSPNDSATGIADLAEPENMQVAETVAIARPVAQATTASLDPLQKAVITSEPVVVASAAGNPSVLATADDVAKESGRNEEEQQLVAANDAEPRFEKAATRFSKKDVPVGAARIIAGKEQIVSYEPGSTSALVMPADRIQIMPVTISTMAAPGLERAANIQTSSIFGPDNTVYQGDEAFATLNTGSPEWEQEVGKHIFLMVDKGTQKISLRTVPPELGPLGIQLQLRDNITHVVFTSHNPDVKSIIEGAAHRLHSMFDAQGLNLGQVQVNISSHQFSDRRSPYPSPTKLSTTGKELKDLSALNGAGTARRSVLRGLIDYYA